MCFNQLRIGGLRAALSGGNPAILQNLPTSSWASVVKFREFLSARGDVLKLFVPHRAVVIVRVLIGIWTLVNSFLNQRLNRHPVSHPTGSRFTRYYVACFGPAPACPPALGRHSSASPLGLANSAAPRRMRMPCNYVKKKESKEGTGAGFPGAGAQG